MLVSNLSDIKANVFEIVFCSQKKLFHKDSLNKAKVPENLKWRIRAQHYDKSFHRRVLHEKALQEAEMALIKAKFRWGYYCRQ
jgi:hypothetical protein